MTARAAREPRGVTTAPFSRQEVITTKVDINAIQPGESPRLAGVDEAHCQILAETSAPLPPILVQRSTMSVIDGLHRLRAAGLRGQEKIEVEFFDGSDDEAFVIAVRANIEHGLPLTLADRKAAASRILGIHPEWSDRSVAAVTGLSHHTVAAVRHRSGGQVSQLNRKVGRDGRVRPVDSARARRKAGELLSRNPDASLREIAKASGISPATVRDVRERLTHGDDPVPPNLRDRRRGASQTLTARFCLACGRPTARRYVSKERSAILNALAKDPSLRLSESGRRFIRLLNGQVVKDDDWDRLISVIPEHLTEAVAEVARGNALIWSRVADKIEQRRGLRVDNVDSAG